MLVTKQRMLALAVLCTCALFFAPALAWAQGSVLQAGPPTSNHAPMYSPGGGFQAVIQDSGPASGGLPGLGLSELLQVNKSPLTSTGSGPLGAHDCQYSAPVTSGAYYYFCTDANAKGGGLIEYGHAGTAPAEPLSINVNGVTYPFPFVTGGIVGPTTTIQNTIPCWNNGVGTLLGVCTAASVIAAGTSQGTATTLTAQTNVITSGASVTGVVIQSGVAAISVLNEVANPINVYPNTGAQFVRFGTNNPVALGAGSKITISCPSPTQCWISS